MDEDHYQSPGIGQRVTLLILLPRGSWGGEVGGRYYREFDPPSPHWKGAENANGSLPGIDIIEPLLTNEIGRIALII